MSKKKYKKYILDGASQQGTQWDNSIYTIKYHEIVTQVTNHIVRDNLYRIESDKRIVRINSDIIDRYFVEIQ